MAGQKPGHFFCDGRVSLERIQEIDEVGLFFEALITFEALETLQHGCMGVGPSQFHLSPKSDAEFLFSLSDVSESITARVR
jgi:hypothetical protein